MLGWAPTKGKWYVFAASFIATLNANNSFMLISKAAIPSVNGTTSLYFDILFESFLHLSLSFFSFNSRSNMLTISAVAVYFNIIIEGVGTVLLPANNSFLFFLYLLYADTVNHIISCDLDNHLYPM